MDHLKMEIESKSENEEFARVAAAVFISRMDPTIQELDDIKIAVSEAFTNAEIHGYPQKTDLVTLEITIEENELTIRVSDQGVGIQDIKKAMEPLFTTDQACGRSGMGFSFMEAFMDSISVESELNHGTTVTMKKRIGR